MQTITIPKKLIQNDDLVVLPRREYEKMQDSMIPVFYLNGKSAKRLDKRVDVALKEYRTGKTKILKSLADLD